MFLLLSLVVALIVVIVTLVYITGKYNEAYWKKRGVKFYSQNKVLGPFWEFLTGDKALFQAISGLYKKYQNEPAVAFGSLTIPSLYVIDAKNVQYVLQAPMFIDRGVEIVEDDYLADNILFMSGNRWKLMRQKMTPLFTSAKLKSMYYIIDKSAQDFIEFLQKNPEKQKPYGTYDTLNMFCCAAVGAAVFGIGSESTFDSPLLEMAMKSSVPSFTNNMKFIMASISPRLFKALNLRFFKEFEPLFIGAIKQVLARRKEEGVKKHDFADICLSIQKNGVMIQPETGYQMDPTDELMAAQGFFFFIAGVEPAASSMFGTIVELGRHSEIQKRVQEEIDAVFEKYNGELSYDAVSEMQYLENVMEEAMRMYPPIAFLTRQSTEATVLPVGNIKIEKGTKVFTPIYDYHHDPRYFKNPDEFNPDRFSNDINHGVLYQPFGNGSRICIGMRYAKLQIKSGLAHLLRNFDLKTVVGKGGMKFLRHPLQLRLKNVNVEYIPRKIKCT